MEGKVVHNFLDFKKGHDKGNRKGAKVLLYDVNGLYPGMNFWIPLKVSVTVKHVLK